MRIEPEGCNAQRHDSNPEIYQVRRPQGQGDIEQHNQRPHSQVYARTCEAGEKGAEIYPGGRKSAACGDITCASKCEIAEDGVGINLRGEHFKDR